MSFSDHYFHIIMWLLKILIFRITITKTYHIAQNFYGGNIDGFDAQLAIHQNFLFSNCIANTCSLRDYLSKISLSNF